MPDDLEDLVLDSRPGPARRIDFEASQAIIEGALDEALGPQTVKPVPSETGSQTPAFVRQRRFRRWIPAAAGLLVAVSTGASAAWLYRVVVKDDPAPAPKKTARPQLDKPPEPATATEAAAEPPVETAPPRRPKRRSTPETPGKLLRTANRLRREGRYATAERTYLRVVKIAPRSDGAYVAYVAAASLRLEHRDSPAGAIRLYRRAAELRPRGSLDGEILYGLGEAHRQLGHPIAERRVLELLVSRYPKSTYATQARARLQELSR